jgi:co-chaperonin GroES (HSP10)
MTIENTSGLRPTGHSVLIEAYEPEFQRSVIQIPENYRRNSAQLEDRAVVIAVGPEAWKDESVPRAKPGDKVMLVKYAGTVVVGTKDKKIYRLVNDREIFCVIEEEV